MLPSTTHGTRGPLLIALHWLGGSANTWTEVAEGFASRGMTFVALDLPGFGDAPPPSSAAMQSTVDALLDTIPSITAAHPGPWLLTGHSMGGKMAAILARAALDGHPGLANLSGLILVSPSPPSPEPMDESTRQKLERSLGLSTGDPASDRAHAEAFVDDNTGKLPLLAAIRNRAVDGILRMDRPTFLAWLTTGSKEDWSARIGTLPLPTLILAGTEEPALGPAAQQKLTLPHLANATLIPLEGSGHLSPLERPAELVERILTFTQSIGLAPSVAPAQLSEPFRALIDSDRTSPQTRAVLYQRLAPQAPAPALLSPDELLTLRAVTARIIPHCPFDLAARALEALAQPQHDGWRHDTLPPDAEAWRIGLRSLSAAALHAYSVPFIALDPARQDALLTQARDGHLGRSLLESLTLSKDHFTAAQMRDWFSDLSAELTRLHIADPRTLQRIGFTGFADDAGFTHIRLGETEPFERGVLQP